MVMASISLKNIVKRYGTASLPCPSSTASTSRSRTANSSCWSALGLRQVHPAAHDRRPGRNHRRRPAIGDNKVNDLEPAKRDIAMVFQNYALYPHMSNYENMAYGLKLAKVPEDEIKRAWTRPPRSWN
jgi:sn-glycerol 3-phosphate transport system ATP-binding protein